MSLIDVMMDECVMLDKRTVSDGLGGFTHEWTEGARFRAAVIKDNTLSARVAEKQGVTEVYTVTVDKGLLLQYHDVFKRKNDGKVFRVTSDGDDKHTPKSATLDMRQVTAEEWSVTQNE